MFNESDESVVERWVENPYWQFFCGYEYMQHECPIHPTTMVKWRQRVGAEQLEAMLTETLEMAVRGGHVTKHQLSKVTADTTVQEKAVAYPTDARLYQKARCRLVTLAAKHGIKLWQSYERVGKYEFIRQSRYANAQQFRRAAKCTRKLRTYLGRVIRDIERNVKNADEELSIMLE
jgi:IS5 family transposase